MRLDYDEGEQIDIYDRNVAAALLKPTRGGGVGTPLFLIVFSKFPFAISCGPMGCYIATKLPLA